MRRSEHNMKEIVDNLQFILYGCWDDSGLIKPSKYNTNVDNYNINELCHFRLKTNKEIGELYKIKMFQTHWSKKCGVRMKWYLKSIELICERVNSFFQCNKWIETSRYEKKCEIKFYEKVN
jgi:hypothetical protein